MATIVTRITNPTGGTAKGSPLTSEEIDANFINLNDNKLEKTGATTVVTLGTVTTGTWNATTLASGYGGTGLISFLSGGALYATSTQTLTTGTLPVASGGTGQTTYTNGQILIGNASGNTLTKATISGTTNQISVSNGNGSITLSTPQNIDTGADFRVNSLGINTSPSTTAGEIRATNNITAYYSDDRLKTRLGKIENALQKVESLDGFYYEANETAQALGYTPVREVGLSAQQVQAILSEIVVPAPIDDKYLTIRYERIIPLLVEAIKELSEEVKRLKENV